jgi:hypothetical protein
MPAPPARLVAPRWNSLGRSGSGDPRAAILDAEHRHPAVTDRYADVDGRGLGGDVDGVEQEVREHLEQPLSRFHPGTAELGRDRGRDAQATLGGEGLDAQRRLADHVCEGLCGRARRIGADGAPSDGARLAGPLERPGQGRRYGGRLRPARSPLRAIRGRR